VIVCHPLCYFSFLGGWSFSWTILVNFLGLVVFSELNAKNTGFGIRRNIERLCVFRWIRVLLLCGSVNIHPYLGMRDVLVWVHYDISHLSTRLAFLFVLSVFNRSMFCLWVSCPADCHHKAKNIIFLSTWRLFAGNALKRESDSSSNENKRWLLSQGAFDWNTPQILKIFVRLDVFVVFNPRFKFGRPPWISPIQIVAVSLEVCCCYPIEAHFLWIFAICELF